MLNHIHTILASHTPLTDEVPATDIFSEDVEQGQQLPYVVLSLSEGEVNNTKNSASLLDQPIFSVFAYSQYPHTVDSTLGSFEIAKLCQDALDYYGGGVGNVSFINRMGTAQNYTDREANRTAFVTEIEFQAYTTN